MEFTKNQIAGLVLGYLKSEKCFGAYNAFLESSAYFQENRQNIKSGKFFATRVMGKCLIDFLEEYANIYSIVQARLEASNYYNEKHPKDTLLDQLIYLLDNTETVGNISPISSATSEVETTPAHTLPGNHCHKESDFSIQKTPKRKTSRSRSSTKRSLDKSEMIDVSGVISQTLLNHELHEKLAETINIVRNTPEVTKNVSDEQISAGASKELDAIIKTVVQRTEEDPVYNKLLDEIIGTAPVETLTTKKSTPTSSNSSHPTEQQQPLGHHSQEQPQQQEQSQQQQVQHQLSQQQQQQSQQELSQNIAYHSDESVKQQPNINKPPDNLTATIDDHNNDAVRSIIAAAQSSEVSLVTHNNEITKTDYNNEVYVFNGTLDTYIKNSVSNPVYTNGLFWKPQEPQKQYYIVNNPPLINIPSVNSVITDNDILSMPTVIVNDDASVNPAIRTRQITNVACSKTKRIIPKRVKTTQVKKTKAELVNTLPTLTPPTVVVTASQPTPTASSSAPEVETRPSSAVRNLDFSTPAVNSADDKTDLEKQSEKKKVWDADLRCMAGDSYNVRSPTPKRKRPAPTNRTRKKTNHKQKTSFEEKLENASDVSEKKDTEVEHKNEEENKESCNIVEKTPPEKEIPGSCNIVEKTPPEKEIPVVEEIPVTIHLETPLKDMIPKTPGFGPVYNSGHCTPINEVLEEQLKGVDLISMPTPQFPITPGFTLTPAVEASCYNRPTDYSTSSSYYQPSDTEQNKSLEQLLEESRKNESNDLSNLNAAKDTEVKQAKIAEADPNEKKNCKEVLKSFNYMVIGKKNLNLLEDVTSSSSSSSDSDTSESDTQSKTIICKKDESERISEIISTVPVKTILTNKPENKSQRSHLEVVRQRTVKVIQDTAQPTQKPNKRFTNKSSKKVTNAKAVKPKTKNKVLKEEETKKLPVASKGKNTRKKKETSNDETDEEAQKLVKGLAQRGIHLIPNKTPAKHKNEPLKKQKPLFHIPEPCDIVNKPGTSKEVFDNQVENEEIRKQTVGEPDQNINLSINEHDAVFDKQTYSDCIDFVFNEKSPSKKKTLNDYDFQCLTKTFKVVVFVEEINTEVERNMKWSSLELLADLPLGDAPSMKNSQTNDDVYDELMDFAVSGGDCGVAEKIAEKPVGNAGGKKRKTRLSEEEKQTDKKCKRLESNINKLLEIGVDTFLDKVHGE